jgi:hypothetical protein
LPYEAVGLIAGGMRYFFAKNLYVLPEIEKALCNMLIIGETMHHVIHEIQVDLKGFREPCLRLVLLKSQQAQIACQKPAANVPNTIDNNLW